MTEPARFDAICTGRLLMRRWLELRTGCPGRSGRGGYFRALRTSSAVGVSPNHFLITASELA